MPKISERTVLFADLRGSTSLYETVGNAAATRWVTACVASLGETVRRSGGRVVKTLGDGLMAVFDSPAQGVQAAGAMQELPTGRPVAAGGAAPLRIQVALAHGEVVELGGDCFGDAVNVAARLLGHAGDDETLATAAVVAGLDPAGQARFRSLDLVQLRGRAEPVHVHLLQPWRVADIAPTAFGGLPPLQAPHRIRLNRVDLDRVYTSEQLPIVLGRGADADCRVDDSRVSRQHARIDANGASFQLVDLSYNGTYVCFAGDTEVMSLRRGACTLHGSGVIALGTPSLDEASPCIRFEVQR